jgi:nucleoside-diphosphate-sugar epimerase
VIALHRADSNLKYLGRMRAERTVGDVTDADSLLRTLPEAVDAVFHVAGDTGLWSRNNAQQDRVNIEGTRYMAAAALAKGARRFVHTSSISAYGMQQGRFDERAPQRGGTSPVNYQRSKFLAEQEVRAAIARGLDAVILNPAGILGAYDTHNYARLVMLVAAGKLPGVPPGSLAFCHVREVANAHIAAAERGRKGENYLLGGTHASLLELVREIGAATGKAVPSRPTPAWLLRTLGFIGGAASRFTGRPPTITPEAARMVTRHVACDSAKAMRELGYRAAPLREMVGDCVAWLAAEGLLPGVQSARHSQK